MGKRRLTSTTQTKQDRFTKPAGSKPNKNINIKTVFIMFFIISTLITLTIYYLFRSVSDKHFISGQPVNVHLNYQQILSENSKVENETHLHFTNPVLAYVTPWNSRGYDMAKRFNSKFTHISPVWYDLKSEETELVLEGTHNADRGWISELRKLGNAKILPRVVLEAFPVQLLQKKKQRRNVIKLLLAECKEMGYDGIVLESWSRWAAYGILHDPDMRKMALDFIKQLGQALHEVRLEGSDLQHLELVYVIGPPQRPKLQPHDFGPEDLKSLGDEVDGYSLMTYDFSSPQNPGPNAPLKWIHSTLEILLGSPPNDAKSRFNKKIFVGINFYGNDFALSEGRGGGAITGRDYLSLLEQHQPSVQWEKNSGEHFFIYSDNNVKHAVFYPTPMSISLRLDKALSWGAGISIWEIGQGLDYFFDVI